MFSETPIKYSKGTTRVINPSETIANVENKLKIAGITRVTEITHLDRIGVPVFSAIRPLAAEGAVSIYAGKGSTVNQAKASAIMEAFERYSAERQESDEDKIIVGTMDSIEGDVVNPISLILPNRLQGNPAVTRIEWVNAINMKTESKIWMPANAVFHPYITRSASHIFKSNTNGLASGNVLEEAILQALCEVIERDAWSFFEVFKNKVRLDVS
jgi:ribosomal protein S12 methylthiotransferase accessory factor